MKAHALIGSETGLWVSLVKLVGAGGLVVRYLPQLICGLRLQTSRPLLVVRYRSRLRGASVFGSTYVLQEKRE